MTSQSFYPTPDHLASAMATAMDDSVTAAKVACPEKARHEGDIVGCGSTDVVGPDEEGLHDCRNCGMFFRAEAT